MATVNVTGFCNLSCSYCYYQPRAQAHMTLKHFEEALTALKAHEIFLLTLSGGEPFLHPQIDLLLRLAHDAFEHVSVLSNGTRIADENLKTIRGIVESKGAFPIQVSLDSMDSDINDDTRGQTSAVLKNLERLKGAGASITVATVISSSNAAKVAETVASLRDITDHFHIMPIKPVPFLGGKDAYLSLEINEMKAAWEELIAIRTEYDLQLKTPLDDRCNDITTSATGAPCMAGFTKLAIDPNLDVRPCDKCVQTVVGNLGRESLEEIWIGRRLAEVYRREVPYCLSESVW